MIEKLANICPLKLYASLIGGFIGGMAGYANPLNGNKNNKLITSIGCGAILTKYPLLVLPYILSDYDKKN